MATTTVSRTKRVLKKKKAAPKKATGKKKEAAKDLSASYNQFKDFEGHQYTGMKVGRSHKWYYDKGEWKETKITPDLWQISYAVTKRRAGRAPEGSGVSVGTEYHWYILAHQNVRKLNANDYTTSMTGLKYKLAHKRADKEKWNTTAKTQRKRMVKILKDLIMQLEVQPIPLEFRYEGIEYKGEGIPVAEACRDGVCYEVDITINDEHIGMIRCAKSGWRMDGKVDQGLVDAIGDEIFHWYE